MRRMSYARPGARLQAESGFEEVWAFADAIPGWLTKEQGRLLWDAGSSAPSGSTIVEIGSHKGRSTVVLGCAARSRGSRVVAIDPFVEGAMFGGVSTKAVFEANIAEAGLDDVVELMPVPSRVARSGWDGNVDVLYIDGKHDYWTVIDDLRWVDFLTPQSRLLIHDAFCSVGVTSALLDKAFLRGHLRYLSRVGTLAEFTVTRSGRQGREALLRQMPWFTRNLTIKVARRVHAKPVLRVLKHDSPVDPY